MNVRLLGAVFFLLSIVAACAPPGGGRAHQQDLKQEEQAEAMQAYRDRENAARERRIRAAEERAAAETPKRTERFRQGWRETGADGPLAQRIREVDGMNRCSLDIQEAQHVLFGNGVLMRWSETQLDERFSLKRPSGDVTIYTGDAIQIRAADGSWVNVVYECDYNHDAGEIVDVRAEQGRLD